MPGWPAVSGGLLERQLFKFCLNARHQEADQGNGRAVGQIVGFAALKGSSYRGRNNQKMRLLVREASAATGQAGEPVAAEAGKIT
jgi:hypothetical protein